MPLYHYTCDHHAEAIIESGVLKPAVLLATPAQKRYLARDIVPRWTSQVIWLTTLESVVWINRCALGLTSESMVHCDRTRHRFKVTEERAVIEPWTMVRPHWPADVVQGLERMPGCKPSAWWVARGPLTCEYAPHLTPTRAAVPA